MTNGAIAPPPALATGLRALRSQPHCVITGDVAFHDASARWVVPVSLEIAADSEFVERRTRWFIVVDPAYPFGKIEVYPVAQHGMAATFPHQARNSPPSEGKTWRTGKLCLDTPFRGERRTTTIRDPIGDADERLHWYAQRALDWLEAAAANRLLAPGDPFELPERASGPISPLSGRHFIHDESNDGIEAWSGYLGTWGTAQLGTLSDIKSVLAVDTFKAQDGAIIRRWSGRPLDTMAEGLPHAYWWLWRDPIVIRPWYSPGTWGDLRCAGKQQRIEVDRVLEILAHRLRGASTPVVLLLGYPAPRYVGDAPVEIHWDAIHLPVIPAAKGKPAPGFRSNDAGWWHRDRQGALRNNAELRPLTTENWHSDRIQARGRLPADVRSARIGIIGVGALGSAIAEMLVRTGVARITLLDPEILVAGNICRHQATLNDIGHLKAKVMARRLREISPHVEVTVVDGGLPAEQARAADALDDVDVIVECTASDEITHVLAEGWWPLPKLFASFSLGHAARRLFSFGVFEHQFPAQVFDDRMSPWLADETGQWAESGELLEGAGCWSPLFPARHDDVVLAAAVCVKEIEALMALRPARPEFRVFEQARTTRGFVGFTLADKPAYDEDGEAQ